ncbi:MAG: hypothetical protein ACI8RZ_003361 [Myxococcota bacterium]|jgi:hypothetical protein
MLRELLSMARPIQIPPTRATVEEIVKLIER